MKRLSFTSLMGFFAVVILLSSSANADRTLFTVSTANPGGPNLRIINALTGATIASIPITLSGFSVLGATGLARDPTSGKLYALLRVTGAGSCQSGLGAIPRLATVNPGTGVATDVGSAGDCFAGLTFSSNGTLYGVTGDRGIVPESLYTFNKTNAARTLRSRHDSSTTQTGCHPTAPTRWNTPA